MHLIGCIGPLALWEGRRGTWAAATGGGEAGSGGGHYLRQLRLFDGGGMGGDGDRNCLHGRIPEFGGLGPILRTGVSAETKHRERGSVASKTCFDPTESAEPSPSRRKMLSRHEEEVDPPLCVETWW